MFHNVGERRAAASLPAIISELLHAADLKLRSASRFEFFCGAFTESV
jgi:hypothetical protein